MRKTIIFALFLAGILSIPACKKEESTESVPSLSGLSITQAVPYVAKGADLVFKASASRIITSDGTDPGTIGLYWQVNDAKRDTLSKDVTRENPEFKYHVDTLGTYAVTCYAFAGSNYYNSSATTSFQAINPDDALTGLAQAAAVTLGGKEWSASNLNTSSGVAYKGAEVVNALFGRFYSWEEAVAACPEGWHLPTAAEWDAIGEDAAPLMAPAKFLDADMWTPAVGIAIENTSGFNAIPVGYQDKSASAEPFRGFGQYAMFWTASDAASDATLAQYRFLRYDNGKVMKGNGDKSSLALSVRCVKD